MGIQGQAARTLAGACIVAFGVATTWACGSSSSGSSGGIAGGADEDGGEAGGPIAASCPNPDAVPARSSSPGTAQFVITNHTNATRWVANDSKACDAFTIDGVALHAAFVCGCECAPTTDGTLTFVRLAAGESTTLEWDETRTVTYTASWSSGFCTNGECSPTPASVTQAVAAGAYSVTFLVADDATIQALGGDAGAADAGDADAGPSSASVPEHIDRVRQPGLCPNVPTLPKVFEVPATFDVEVDVSIDS